MSELLYFYMDGCPHCRKADRFLEELISEKTQFKDIKITKIEERKNSKLAEKYDYYYVPCFFMGEENLHEGSVTKDDIEAVLEKALV